MSREYRGKRIVVYPAYIDADLPRSRGRRVPRRLAVPHPRIEEIVEAAEKLGLNPLVEDARYPRVWWLYDKRVVVDKRGAKTEVLRMIASMIKKRRSRR